LADRSYDLDNSEVEMTHDTRTTASHDVLSTQEIALHMIASAARVLLMIGTAVLVGEVAAGPARRLIAARRNGHGSDQAPLESAQADP
jgi:hypothetical protein